MKRKIVWLGVSWLIMAALVLTSCGQEEEGLVTLSIGETYQTSEVAATVSEAIVTDSYEYYDKASESILSKEASTGMSFLIITVEIKNVGSADRYDEGERWFRIYASGGSTYKHVTLYYAEDRLTPAGYIIGTTLLRAGEEMEGTVLFNIPEGASGLKLKYWALRPTAETPDVEWVIE